MLLSDLLILAERDMGRILIDPFDRRQLGPNSYDARLGEWYYIGQTEKALLHIEDEQEIKAYWGEAKRAENQRIAIPPGMTVLAHTQERVGCVNGYVAKMYARSTVARSGLSVCRCAGIGDSGYIGFWTMEICNHTQTTITVPVGFRICQFTFEYIGETLSNYHGKYGRNHDWTPEDMLPKPYLDWDYDLYHRK